MVRKKAQQGRAKQKQKAQRGNQAGPSRTSKQNKRIADFDDEDDDTFQGFRGFAQLNSTVGRSPRTTYDNLRHQRITFVSAGVNPPTVTQPSRAAQELLIEAEDDDDELDDDLNTPSDDEDDDIDDNIETNILMEDDAQVPEDGIANMKLDSSSEEVSFVVDVTGDPHLNDKPASRFAPIARIPSPALSNSSEEIVLFHGRNNITNQTKILEDPFTQPVPQQLKTQHAVQESEHITDDLLLALTETTVPDTQKSDDLTRNRYLSGGHPQGDEWFPAPTTPYWRKKKGESQREFEAAKRRDGDTISTKVPTAIAESTSAAFQVVWNDVLRAKNRRLKDLEAKSKPSKRRGKRGRKKDNRAMIDAVFSDDDPLGEEAAYNDYMENLAAQLDEDDDEDSGIKGFNSKDAAHSFAISAPSMVVDGREYADDELLTKHSKDSEMINNEGDEWESESDSVLNPDSDELSSEGSLNASDLEKDLEYSEQQQWEDEADLRQRRIDRMTDEHLARLFAKQEELGYEGDELMIDDGADMTSDGVGDVAAAREGLQDLVEFSITKKQSTPRLSQRKQRRNRSHAESTSFPDATLFADTLDQYDVDGFDIMDFERPSLRANRKRGKGKLPPEIDLLSDDELKETLNDAWENDRAKKKQRKLERESLRAQGLLGSGGLRDRADLSVKYSQGMTMKQVHDELKAFLRDESDNERVFPPMNKIDRKALHEIAHVMNIVSKSRGTGKNRFTTLHKTKQTVAFSEGMFARIVEASSRGFLTNQRMRGKRAVRDNIAKRPGIDKSSVTLRNGEIVGAGAAELGRENFGHRLMEKMGWAKGQAIGKDGSGLLVPVEQRMRIGTAGLG